MIAGLDLMRGLHSPAQNLVEMSMDVQKDGEGHLGSDAETVHHPEASRWESLAIPVPVICGRTRADGACSALVWRERAMTRGRRTATKFRVRSR